MSFGFFQDGGKRETEPPLLFMRFCAAANIASVAAGIKTLF